MNSEISESDAEVLRSFKAAVQVLSSLPNNESYQISEEMLLRFYGLFKQATNGPSLEAPPKSSAWFSTSKEKKKYLAWKNIGNKSRREAMVEYVEDLKNIVETMQLTSTVADFLDQIGDFYEPVPDDEVPISRPRVPKGPPPNFVEREEPEPYDPNRVTIEDVDMKMSNLKFIDEALANVEESGENVDPAGDFEIKSSNVVIDDYGGISEFSDDDDEVDQFRSTKDIIDTNGNVINKSFSQSEVLSNTTEYFDAQSGYSGSSSDKVDSCSVLSQAGSTTAQDYEDSPRRAGLSSFPTESTFCSDMTLEAKHSFKDPAGYASENSLSHVLSQIKLLSDNVLEINLRLNEMEERGSGDMTPKVVSTGVLVGLLVWPVLLIGGCALYKFRFK